MQNLLKSLSITGACALLAGCGGGSGDLGGLASYDEVSTAASAMATANSFDAALGEFTVATRADISGQVTATDAHYEGFITDDLGDTSLVGETEMTVDFEQATVTGSATNFYHETDGAYTGTLTLDGGEINTGATASDPDTLDGTFTGSLINAAVNYNTDITISGEFTGGTGATTPSAVGGTADGLVGSDLFIGSFISELQ